MDSQTSLNLFPNEFKAIESQIIDFFVQIGEILDHNKTSTKIFAYFKVYKLLTQDELKHLTNFSSSTISTTLQAFLNSDILIKDLIPNQRKYAYRLRDEKVSFIYIVFSQIIEELERLDLLTVKYQKKVKKFQDKYPNIVEYFNSCLNSLRNYVEAQRRAINYEKKFSFFKEYTSKKFLSMEILDYPKEIQQIEENFVDELSRSNYFSVINPIKNRILSYIITRQKFSQETLISLTGFSRSTISRVLNDYLDDEFIKTMPREYQKPLFYYQDSFSIAIMNLILKSDHFIFSWIPKFKNLMKELNENTQYTTNKKTRDFLIMRINKILDQIEELKSSSKLLEQAKSELQDFLGL